MPTSAHLSFETLNGTLKAAGEATRLRILALLGEAELTVSDLTAILRQSQPRISRHLRLLAEAGLVERFREGSWAFFRLAERGGAATLARELVSRLDPDDATLGRDRERLVAVRTQRADAAQAYFAPPCRAVGPHSQASCRRRGGGGSDQRRARRCRRCARCSISAPAPGACSNCSGRGSSTGLGLDLSLDMLAVARARLDRAGLRHCSVRQGDIYDLALPKDSFDVVIVHQVLHFLDDGARAIHEAARVLRPGRPPAGRRFRSPRSGISARRARPPAARLLVRYRGAMDEGRRPRRACCSAALRRSRPPKARSRSRSGSVAIRASCWPPPRARWRDDGRDPRQPLRADP